MGSVGVAAAGACGTAGAAGTGAAARCAPEDVPGRVRCGVFRVREERGRVADEYLAAMVELWTSDRPRFAGRYVSFEDVAFEPKPRRAG